MELTDLDTSTKMIIGVEYTFENGCAVLHDIFDVGLDYNELSLSEIDDIELNDGFMVKYNYEDGKHTDSKKMIIGVEIVPVDVDVGPDGFYSFFPHEMELTDIIQIIKKVTNVLGPNAKLYSGGTMRG